MFFRNYRSYKIKSNNILWIYTSMILLGLLFFLPILALYFEESLFTVTNVALIFSIHAFTSMIFEVPSGAFADLFGRKKTLIVSYIIFIIALIFLYIGGSMIIFVLYAFLAALAGSLFSGTDVAIIYDTLKEEKKEKHFKKIIGTYHALWPMGAVIGSVVGGYLAKISLSTTVLYSFIPTVLAGLFVLFIKEPKYKKEEHRNVIKHMFNSLKLIIGSKQLFLLFLGAFILWSFGETIHHLAPLFFKFKEIPIHYFGWIFAVIFGFSSIGHYFSHEVSEKIGNRLTLIISSLIGPVLLIIATILTNFSAIIIYVIPSLIFGLRNPIVDHLINLEVSSSKRATINSVRNFTGAMGFVIFAPAIGYFAELYTINSAFKIAAVMMFIAPIVYLFLKEKN